VPHAFTIGNRYQTFHLTWELLPTDPRRRIERYKIATLKDPEKYIILENNRPLIRGKYKLKNRRIDWNQVYGQMSAHNVEKIIEVIENHLAGKQPAVTKNLQKTRKRPPSPRSPFDDQIRLNEEG
jgi:hypothetical protein